MPRSSTLHGQAPDSSPTALLILDLISDFSFPDGNQLLRQARPVAARIAALKKRATRAGVPTIYVNDNSGRWCSDRSQLISHCLSATSRGRDLVAQLEPREEDYFIMKPKHSGFFGTPLHVLLDTIGARTLILTGVTSHQCILFTATDAYVRGFDLVIPRDCIAAMRPTQTRAALAIFTAALRADTTPSARLKLSRKQPRRASG